MRKALCIGVLLAALAHAAPAAAGCWATVQLAPPPAGTTAGKAWTAELTVLQHGRNPLPDAADARPTVIITNAAGDRKSFTAEPVDSSKGLYSTDVVFPSAGTWNYAVVDGFSTSGGQPAPCERTHELGTVKIGKSPPGISTAGGGFPLQLAAGLGATLLLGGGVVFFGRKRRLRASRTAAV